MTPVRLLAAVAGALAAVAPGQRAVVPPWCAWRDGNAADVEPFGRDHVRHVHYVDRGLLRAVPAGARLRELAYRRDAAPTRPPVMRRVLPGGARPRPTWVVRMANFAGDVLGVSSAYPPIHGGPFTVVFGAKPVDFPDLAPTETAPPPFAIRFVLDRPFAYAGAHLAIEHASYVFQKTYYAYAIDAVAQRGRGGKVVARRRSCPGTPRIHGVAGGPGSRLDLYVRAAAPGAVSLLAFPRPGVTLAPQRADARGFVAHHLRLPLATSLAGLALAATWHGRPGSPSDPLRARIVLAAGAEPPVGMTTVSGFADSHVPRGYVQRRRGPVFELVW